MVSRKVLIRLLKMIGMVTVSILWFNGYLLDSHLLIILLTWLSIKIPLVVENYKERSEWDSLIEELEASDFLERIVKTFSSHVLELKEERTNYLAETGELILCGGGKETLNKLLKLAGFNIYFEEKDVFGPTVLLNTKVYGGESAQDFIMRLSKTVRGLGGLWSKNYTAKRSLIIEAVLAKRYPR